MAVVTTAQPPVPLIVIGGYLGTGKTTLVNHLLRQAAGRRVAVLVNDFGSVSIDADLIEGASDGVLALAGGCVCCSFGEDLIGTVQRAARRDPRPDVMLLECSGVGLPATVARNAALAGDVRVDGVVVVVDASQVRQLATDRFVGDTVCAQLQQADLLIVNQQDRCTPHAVADVRAWLTGVARDVPQADGVYGRIPPDLILGLRIERPPEAADWQGSSGRYRRANSAMPHRMRHTERHIDDPVDPGAWAQQLVEAGGGRLLRAKGVVPGIDGQWWQVHVMGRRIDVQVHAAGGVSHAGTVVCIEALPDGGGTPCSGEKFWGDGPLRSSD